MKGLALTLVGALLAGPAHGSAASYATCDGKRGYQRDVVREIVHDWFGGAARGEGLLELVQAEQGIAACRAGGGRPVRLHSTTLPRGLALDQLGGVLLSNELQWSGFLPEPHEGLAGEFFRVKSPFGESAAE
jgi:hypothetical protein